MLGITGRKAADSPAMATPCWQSRPLAAQLSLDLPPHEQTESSQGKVQGLSSHQPPVQGAPHGPPRPLTPPWSR